MRCRWRWLHPSCVPSPPASQLVRGDAPAGFILLRDLPGLHQIPWDVCWSFPCNSSPRIDVPWRATPVEEVSPRSSPSPTRFGAEASPPALLPSLRSPGWLPAFLPDRAALLPRASAWHHPKPVLGGFVVPGAELLLKISRIDPKLMTRAPSAKATCSSWKIKHYSRLFFLIIIYFLFFSLLLRLLQSRSPAPSFPPMP